MTDNSALDALEDRTQSPNQQDYADWWNPHQDDPGQLVGIVVEAHDTQYNEGDPVNPVFTVRSIGEPSDFDKGTERATRTHVQLVRGLEQHDVQLGDLVNLNYTGLEATDGGNAANTYEIGVVKESEWQDMEEADLLSEVKEMNGGLYQDSRGELDEGSEDDDTTQSALDQAGATEGGSGNEDESADDESVDVDFDEEVLEFAQGTLDMQNHEMPFDQLDQMLNDVRDFDVDTEAVAEHLGYSVDGGTITDV